MILFIVCWLESLCLENAACALCTVFVVFGLGSIQVLRCTMNMWLPHILLIAAFFAYSSKVCISHIFPHKLAFSTAVLILFMFLSHIVLLGFVTSAIWLPTEWHHTCVRTPVERDGVVGFKQFCTVFCATYLAFVRSAYLKKCRIKLRCLFRQAN